MTLSNLAVATADILKNFSAYFVSTGLAVQAFFLIVVMLILAFITFSEFSEEIFDRRES